VNATKVGLDEAVAAANAALERAEVVPPRALYLLATGGGLLPLRLAHGSKTALAKIAGVPEAWRGATLHAGELAGTPVWIVEDAPGSAETGGLPSEGEPGWMRGFPCWLAGAAGASVLVHASAGASLVPDLEPGTLVLASDHLNLSGRTPLAGLAGSRLGPLFPDLSAFHHAELRASALRLCAKLGIRAREAVAACAIGPALETPAERRFFARAGAGVSVQGLEGPLLAAAHAGLRALAIACVTDRGEEASDLAAILARAEAMAPALEELLAALAPEIGNVAARLENALETDA
jgi:purine-nucleoside phosphorylase